MCHRGGCSRVCAMELSSSSRIPRVIHRASPVKGDRQAAANPCAGPIPWRAGSGHSPLLELGFADWPAHRKCMPDSPPAAARPRDAATLILVRRDAAAPRILMGRRSGGHDFMPDKWVFPGGRIDRSDYVAPYSGELRPDVAANLAATARLRRQDGGRLARALARTAIRETFEETGLVIGRVNEGRLTADLSGLDYIARAITPPARHKRFDARFLLADAEHLASLEPTDSRELGEVAWFTLEDCRGLDLPTVTRAVLDVVDRHLSGQAYERPFWRWIRGRSDSAL